MTDLSVKRTLVKSPPELWSELSEVESLAQHLGELGEIRISRLEPEHTVVWEGEQVRGTVEIEASGWGTKVTLTAEALEAPAAEPERSDAVVGDFDVEPETGELDVEPETERHDVEPEAVQVEVAPAAAQAAPEAGAPAREPDPELAVEPAPAGGRRTRERRGLLGRWLSRHRHAASGSDTAAPAPVIEPILASAIADGAIEVVERGSGRAERGVPLPQDFRGEPGPGELASGDAPEDPYLGREAEPAEPAAGPALPDCGTEPMPEVSSGALERARDVLESTLDSLGQAHHRPFSRE